MVIIVNSGNVLAYTPKAEKVTDNVYAFIGPLGQRSEANEAIQDVMEQYNDLPQFKHLEHYETIHRTNMNRTYLEFKQL